VDAKKRIQEQKGTMAGDTENKVPSNRQQNRAAVGQRSNHSVEVAVAAPCDVSILIRGGCAAYLTIPYLSRMVRYSLWLRSHVIFAPEVAVDGRTNFLVC
jgi:hypothetical protein